MANKNITQFPTQAVTNYTTRLYGVPTNSGQDATIEISVLFTDPIFTGNPTTTTQATADNSTRLATTAYVKNNFAVPPGIGTTTPNTGSFTTLGTSGLATLASLSTSAATITGGTINGTSIGATTASTGRFTTVTTTGTATFTGAVTLSGGLNTPLVVAQGGTGAASLTTNQLVVGRGTGALTVLAAGTAGQVLTSGGAGVDPSWSSAAATTGRLIGIQTFTTPGSFTYTPTAGTTSVIVEVQGAGGGAGGAASGTNASQFSSGLGGGGGGYALSRLTTGFSGATVVVGQGGAGGVNNATASSGTASSFAGTIIGNGGTGGVVITNTGYSVGGGGAGGTASGGNILNINGEPGPTLQQFAGVSGIPNLICAEGGSSHLAPRTGANAPNSNGINGTQYGAGGSGGNNGPSQAAARTGGSGANGIVVIYEYS